jgi:hypothetical protein
VGREEEDDDDDDDRTAPHEAASSAQMVAVTWGLTAMTTRSASAVAEVLEVVVLTPRSASLRRAASTGSETVMWVAGMALVFRSPLMMAVAMLHRRWHHAGQPVGMAADRGWAGVACRANHAQHPGVGG